VGFELTMLVVIGTDYVCNNYCKYNYHTIPRMKHKHLLKEQGQKDKTKDYSNQNPMKTQKE
jgi:hypothetical protein